MTTCKQCSAAFEIFPEDLAFYDKISPIIGGAKQQVPPPTLCPDCRQQRRLTFRNERKYYHRKCDLTGKQMISIYAPQSPFTVYEKDAWWSDRWDPLTYGRDVDFSRPFFEQIHELQLQVPRPSLYQKNVENSDYTNHVENLKNGYLSVDVGAGSEDIYYSKWIIASKNICDCYQLEKAELCYESLYSVGEFRCIYIYLSDNCRDSSFLFDCQGCEDCFLCSNLRHKKFCFGNEQLTEEEYRKRMSQIDLGSHTVFRQCLEQYLTMVRTTAIHRSEMFIHCEDCTGDFLYKCKNVRDSFEVIDSQDCRYCYDAGFLKDCYDMYESAFDCELQYESSACNRGKSIIGTDICYDVSSLYYCNNCHNSHDLFGCSGLKRHQYCILNKQYTKEEYEALIPKIIAQMQQAGEWGEHPPAQHSPFAYNETVAQEVMPLTREAVLERGWKWLDEAEQADQYLGPSVVISDNIRDVTDDITKQILRCEVTDKPYKIIPQELTFCRDMNVPVPRRSPDQRHMDRMALRNPRRMWNRQCALCHKAIRTTFAPERTEIVYCDDCYLKSVY